MHVWTSSLLDRRVDLTPPFSGHAIGMNHSLDSKSTVMYPYHLGYRASFPLTQDDIDGCKVTHHHLGTSSIGIHAFSLSTFLAWSEQYIVQSPTGQVWCLTCRWLPSNAVLYQRCWKTFTQGSCAVRSLHQLSNTLPAWSANLVVGEASLLL